MDGDQTQYGSLGFIGIYRETFRLIFTWKKIFTHITLALIVPLCFVSLAHSDFKEIFFTSVLTDTVLDGYNHRSSSSSEFKVIYSGHGWIVASYFFKALYFIIVLLLSLLSTSAVVYTIACIYTNKDHTFRKVMDVVPKASKRLSITFLWSLAIYLILIAVWLVLLSICVFITEHSRAFGIGLFVVLLIAFAVACLYTTVIIQIAYAVSILEDDYGRKAIVKGRALVKGKIGTAVGCYLVLLVLLSVVELIFELFVSGSHLRIFFRILIGVVFMAVVVFLYLVELVYQTVVYFVCKSFHNEHIDGPALAHHLEGYSQMKDVQLEPVNKV